jgi:fumarate hydratase subunit alpha
LIREIKAADVTKTVSRLFQKICYVLPDDVTGALKKASDQEDSPVARGVLDKIIENSTIAAKGDIPLCQDTGMAVVFVEIGQDTHIIGGDFETAVNEGVREGYVKGYLRKSVVDRPFSTRINTGDNTPAIIHTSIVPGDKVKISAMSKGFGSENMSRLAMLLPGKGRRGVIDFVVKCVDEAGSNPCPPLIIGVGIGGTIEKCALLAKRALLRKVGEPHAEAEIADLEKEILDEVNKLGIGAMGYGGRITALAVHLEVFPTHIAGLPVAVNLQCHSDRHKEAIIF